jgi:hypothetical protein
LPTRPARRRRHAKVMSQATFATVLTAQPTLAETVGTLLPLMAIIPASVPSAINRAVSPRLWRNPLRHTLRLQPAIRGMVWQVVERFGEQAAHTPQSIAWCRRLWRNPARQSASPTARNPSHGLARRDCPRCADDRRRMYVVDNHGGLTPPALASHECASAGDLRLPLHARYPATGGLRPPLLCGTNANLEVVCRKCRRCHRGERRPW